VDPADGTGVVVVAGTAAEGGGVPKREVGVALVGRVGSSDGVVVVGVGGEVLVGVKDVRVGGGDVVIGAGM